jgi:hypothetical protein
MALKFQETLVADADWLAAGQHVSVALPSRDLTADGTCGRCLHETSSPIDLEPVAVASAVPGVGPLISLDVTRMFRCRCTWPHDSRPASVYTGCGGYWFARATGTPGSYTLNPAPPGFAAGAVAVDQAKKDQAGLVQRTAEKWLGAITALLALFSVGGTALSANAVATLNTAGKLFAAVAAVLAVACGAVAIVYGYRAAYGWLTLAPASTDADANALADPSRGIRERVTAFQRSAPAAGISLALAAVALMVIWFAPPANPPSPTVKITYGQGGKQTTLCGTLLDSANSAVVRVEIQDGPRTTIQRVPQPVTSITAVAAC